MRQQHTSACRVSERAKLCACPALVVFVMTGPIAGCTRSNVVPVYDPASRIRRLDFDTDDNGRVDTRAYLRDGRVMRIEVDGNNDGIVDRWEYFDGNGQLSRVGTSSESDGVEDTWVTQRGEEMRVDISTRRDGVVDRHELHDKGALVSADQDTNGDGRIDQWQHFVNGRLTELLIDTTGTSGHPDRRLLYAADGSLARVDAPAASAPQP
jgi:hypothetical protein